MNQHQKTLYHLSVFLMILLVMDFFGLISNVMRGQYQLVSGVAPTVQMLANFIIIFVFSMVVVEMMIRIYLIIRAYSESQNPTGATLHITVAKVMAGINIVLAVFMFSALFGSSDLVDDIFTLLLCVIDATIMVLYVRTSTAVLQK